MRSRLLLPQLMGLAVTISLNLAARISSLSKLATAVCWTVPPSFSRGLETPISEQPSMAIGLTRVGYTLIHHLVILAFSLSTMVLLFHLFSPTPFLPKSVLRRTGRLVGINGRTPG